MYPPSFLKTCVYPQEVFDGHYDILPGERIEENLGKIQNIDIDIGHLERKLHQSCHKLCLMWKAGAHSIEAEREFYSSTIKDAPALFGEDAIKVNYHLESLVLFARSALDVSSTIFGHLLPDPFTRKRLDSFNKLVKGITKEGDQIDIAPHFEELRENEVSWLSIISNTHKGRSLRDKITHQMDFPIDYEELHSPSEKETAIVWVNKNNYLPLETFVPNLTCGVIECFLTLL